MCSARGVAEVLGTGTVGTGFGAVRPGGRGCVGGVVGTGLVVAGALAVAVTSGGFVAAAGGVAALLATAGGALSAGFSVVM
ncbi:MAG TPA: hypothetical protein VGC79_05780 [Polyangiaceae bacterium]